MKMVKKNQNVLKYTEWFTLIKLTIVFSYDKRITYYVKLTRKKQLKIIGN